MSAVSDDLIETAKQVGVALKGAHIPFALGGGCAVFARGGPGSQHDVDVLLRERDVDAAVTALTAAGLRRGDCPEDWLVKAFHGDRLVDLIVRVAGRAVDDAFLGRADVLEVGSVAMPVLGATDIVTGKLLALGAHSCDFAPLLADVRALREQVDWARVQEETAESPYARAFLTLVKELDVIPGKEELWPKTPVTS